MLKLLPSRSCTSSMTLWISHVAGHTPSPSEPYLTHICDSDFNISYQMGSTILNDSILSYQITEDDDYSPYSYGIQEKWSKSKKTPYTLAPAINSDGEVYKEKLVFQFENYQGELEILKSKKKKKFRICTPLSLKDGDNIFSVFLEE